MAWPTTACERIRETSMPASAGLPNNLVDVLKAFLLDDLMNPRQNNKLRLIETYIRNKLVFDLGIEEKDSLTQENLINKMMATNEKTITDWVTQLEKLKLLKSLITQDIHRFEEKVQAYNSQLNYGVLQESDIKRLF